MAKVSIIGNLGRDAELRYLPSGLAVLDFSIAANERWTDRNGQQQENTTWFRISVFGKQADVLKQYLTRGKQVYVDGRLRMNEYTDRNGEKRFSLDVKADTVQLLGSRGAGEDRSAAPPRELQNEDQQYSDSDIPF